MVGFQGQSMRLESAIPILLVHGWPGSFFEFSQVWDRLSTPGNPSDQAFNAVSVNMQDTAGCHGHPEGVGQYRTMPEYLTHLCGN